jgi:probable rRNA maturation factor
VEYGVKMKDETARLMLHGILHLTGYDHEKSPREEARMRKKEEEILAIL